MGHWWTGHSNGVLWFVGRRQWRNVAIALGVTLAVALPSMVLRPDLWTDWVNVLQANAATPGALPIPGLVRLPLAGLLVLAAARYNWAWAVPIGTLFAIGTLWPNSLVLLVACIPLLIASRQREISPGAGP